MMCDMMPQKRTTESVCDVKPTLRYFKVPGRAHMARTALEIGGVDFNDEYGGEHFDWKAVSADKNSWAWTKSFGFMPILMRGEAFSVC
jgi:hypothetical protein